MSKQDKATTEKYSRTLRELVKKPDNKVCADCKRNDPRWASWNLGVFLCIRCSGIHRGMGTHISKVKSIDLDVWTPEQMESIQKWGNRLANMYWEAHLKRGHVPPDHKMEAFIRSKYESRRWALEGPPPNDPSTLDDGSIESQDNSTSFQPNNPSPPASSSSHQRHTSNTTLSNRNPTSTRSQQGSTPQLLSAAYHTQQQHGKSNPTGVSPSVPVPGGITEPPKQIENDLFNLDFHAPPPSTTMPQEQPKKDVKQDILSLFSTTTPPALPAFGQPAAALAPTTSPLEAMPQTQTQQQHVSPPTSMVGGTGVGAWGVNSGWNNNPSVSPAQPSLWGSATLQQQPNLFASSNDVWGNASTGAGPTTDLFGSANMTGNSVTAPKKDDVFGDIWGSLK